MGDEEKTFGYMLKHATWIELIASLAIVAILVSVVPWLTIGALITVGVDLEPDWWTWSAVLWLLVVGRWVCRGWKL